VDRFHSAPEGREVDLGVEASQDAARDEGAASSLFGSRAFFCNASTIARSIPSSRSFGIDSE
jgi:hypothetical protein